MQFNGRHGVLHHTLRVEVSFAIVFLGKLGLVRVS